MAHALMKSHLHGTSRPVVQCRDRDVVCRARKVSSGKQVCCNKTLVAKPGHEDQVAKLVAGVTSFSLQQAKDRSSGVVVFEAVRDAWEPGTFHTWERYDSNQALSKHNTTPEYTAFLQQVHPHLQHPVAVALYEYKNGQLGPASLAEGPKGEGGLDDATGASGAAGGASMKQTSSAFNLVGVEEHHDDTPLDVLTSGLSAAKKQMDGLKNIFGNIFGSKKEPAASGQEGKEQQESAGRK